MATTALEIRRLTYADLPQVIALSKPSGICLAAMRDNRLAGYLICSRYDRVWHIMNVAIDPDHRRQGMATALLNRLLERVGEDDARFTLEVRRSNAGAIVLYERFGFKVAGLRRRYYQDNGEDAFVMWRTPGTLEGRLDDVPNAQPPLGHP